MARGFESKAVEFQQAQAGRTITMGRALTPDGRDAAAATDPVTSKR